MKLNKVEAIVWRDAFHPFNCKWNNDEDVEEFLSDTDYMCCNLGWVIHEDKKMVTIASMVSKQDQVSHIQRIPIGCIIKRVKIKNPF